MNKLGIDFSFVSTETPQQVSGFDSAAGDAVKMVEVLSGKAFESELMQIRKAALIGVLSLADDILTDDLGDDEVPSDRLDVYLLGDQAHHFEDDEVAQVQAQKAQIMSANMADALSSLGVDDQTIEDMFNDDLDRADMAIESMAETVEANTPQSEALEDFIEQFVFGEDELDMEAGQIEEYDSARKPELGKNKVRKTKTGQTLVYKGVKAVRHGKIVVVNKRVGNTFVKLKLSPKQKMALKKAAAKAISTSAIKKRVKSLMIGHRQGIYKQNRGM